MSKSGIFRERPVKALIQRISWSRVSVNDREVSATGPGLLVLLGIADQDNEGDARFLAVKTAALRIFEDDEGKMNLSVIQAGGEVMVVSQFTLVADTRKGNRPGFGTAAPPDQAKRYYELFVEELEKKGVGVKTGVFGAEMAVSLENDGPVTILLESK